MRLKDVRLLTPQLNFRVTSLLPLPLLVSISKVQFCPQSSIARHSFSEFSRYNCWDAAAIQEGLGGKTAE